MNATHRAGHQMGTTLAQRNHPTFPVRLDIRGAGGRDRTDGLLITNQLLYH